MFTLFLHTEFNFVFPRTKSAVSDLNGTLLIYEFLMMHWVIQINDYIFLEILHIKHY